jgi:TorA maturation chaperone TorD
MAVERFYRSCGVGQPANSNEPLDHIGSELEFLQYLCLVNAELVSPPEDVDFPEDAYGQFYRTHFAWFAKCMAESLAEQSTLAFYRSLARLLALVCAKFAQCQGRST